MAPNEPSVTPFSLEKKAASEAELPPAPSGTKPVAEGDDFLALLATRPARRRRPSRRRFVRRSPALLPSPSPSRNVRPPWVRRLFAWIGLVLFVGCLFALLDGRSLSVWHSRENTPVFPANGPIAVVIDPGHGGWDTGAVAQGVREKDLNLDVGLRVARVLETHNVRTRMTREDDHFVTLAGRVQLGNSLPGAIFVSIHFNDAPGEGHAVSRASGIETFYSEAKEAPSIAAWTLASLLGGGNTAAVAARPDPAQAVRDGRDLADSIQSSLITGTAATDRGIKERRLYVTRRVQGPAVLVEGGFVSHPAEAKLLGDSNYRQKLAESIAGGIVKYLAGTRRQAGGAPLAATHTGPP